MLFMNWLLSVIPHLWQNVPAWHLHHMTKSFYFCGDKKAYFKIAIPSWKRPRCHKTSHFIGIPVIPIREAKDNCQILLAVQMFCQSSKCGRLVTWVYLHLSTSYLAAPVISSFVLPEFPELSLSDNGLRLPCPMKIITIWQRGKKTKL